MALSIFFEHIAQGAVQRSISLPEACRAARNYGYQYVALDFARIEAAPDRGQSSLAALQCAGLCVHSLYGFFAMGEKDETLRIQTFLDTAHTLQAACALFVPGFISADIPPEKAEHQTRAMISGLRYAAAYAEALGIEITMEDFDDSTAPYATSTGLLTFLSQIPGLTCTFDTGNFIYSQEDALAAFDALCGYITQIHCKDRCFTPQRCVPSKQTVSGKPMYPVAVGAGDLPITELAARFAAHATQTGKPAVFTVEHFDVADQLAAMEASAKFLQKYMA